jgi:thioredoxin 1
VSRRLLPELRTPQPSDGEKTWFICARGIYRIIGEKMASDAIVEVTDANFDKVIKENPVVVVDFWAVWCMPCKVIAPYIEDLAKRYAGKAVFAKLDADPNPVKMREYGVMGVPTLLFFKNGKLVDNIVGAVPKAQIESKLKKYL